jgi:glycosyltransferase involved in cell wall biosynthesis
VTRRILIVTPFFAPQSHAAVFRAYKLAKYLHRYGWQVHVLTVDTNYAYNEDRSLLEALPASVQVHRARYVEPTGRGLSFVLGMADRRFSTLRARATGVATGTAEVLPSTPPSLRRRVSRLLRSAINAPDAYWTWFFPAWFEARRIAAEHQIELVFTSADPYTSHALGYALQLGGLRWVADLRDPHTHCHRTQSRLPWIFALQRELERAAALHADAVTVAARSIAMILKESYGITDDARFHFIPTGLDEALVASVVPAVRSRPYLIFCGEYLVDYGDAIFRLFARALQEPAIRAKQYEFLVVGRREVNEPRLAPTLRELGLQGHVTFIDHVPQSELYGLIAGAEFATLCYGAMALWWCLPAKLVDYHALRKPVLAVVPNPSEARARLMETGLGIFLDGEAAQATFDAALISGSSRIAPNAAECDRYLATSQVKAFVAVFERLIAG